MTLAAYSAVFGSKIVTPIAISCLFLNEMTVCLGWDLWVNTDLRIFYEGLVALYNCIDC